MVKNSPADARAAGDMGLIPGWGCSPGGGNATHSSILAGIIPWTEELGRLQSMGSQIVGHDLVTEHTLFCSCYKQDRESSLGGGGGTCAAKEGVGSKEVKRRKELEGGSWEREDWGGTTAEGRSFVCLFTVI